MTDLMNQGKWLEEMIEMQKNMFNNSLKTMTVVQDRAEKMMDMSMKQASWVSEKWNSAIADWSKYYQDGMETFKKIMESNLKKS